MKDYLTILAVDLTIILILIGIGCAIYFHGVNTIKHNIEKSSYTYLQF